MVSDSVTMFWRIWQLVMVSEIVRGASISKLYVPAYEDYVVGEQSLEWRWSCRKGKTDCLDEIFLGTKHRQWQTPMAQTHGIIWTGYV